MRDGRRMVKLVGIDECTASYRTFRRAAPIMHLHRPDSWRPGAAGGPLAGGMALSSTTHPELLP